jgi:NADPH2:quinone reductase
MTVGGTMAEYAVTGFEGVVPLPEHISNEEGSSFFVNPMTVVGMVKRCQELNAKSVIINAACSQLCRMVIKLCQTEEFNLPLICIVRRQQQVDILTEMGCKYIANSSAEDYKEKMAAYCKELQPNVCLDAIGGPTTGEMMGYLAQNGTCIVYGLLSGEPCSYHPLLQIGKNLKTEAFFLMVYMAQLPVEEKIKMVETTIRHYKTSLSTHIHKRYGFDQVKEAFDYYMANMTEGKILFKSELTGKTQ